MATQLAPSDRRRPHRAEDASVGTSHLRAIPSLPPTPSPSFTRRVWNQRQVLIAFVATIGIAAHLLLRFALHAGAPAYRMPLFVVLSVGGIPLVVELLVKVA